MIGWRLEEIPRIRMGLKGAIELSGVYQPEKGMLVERLTRSYVLEDEITIRRGVHNVL